MSKNWKRLLTVAGVGFVLLVIWVVQTTPTEPPPVERLESPTTMEYEGNELSEEINGVRLWDLTADRMVVDAGTQDAELEKLVGHFYSSDGRSLEFRADHGRYEYATKDIHIDGNILVETSDGARLMSERLDWVSADGLLIATEDVRLSKGDLHATGDRAESSDGLRHFWLKGHARLTKNLESDADTDR